VLFVGAGIRLLDGKSSIEEECLQSKPVPDMTYNVFGWTLSLTQSINQSIYATIVS